MGKHASYGGLTMLMVTASFFLILLGILWLFNGIGDENTKLIFQGTAALISGFGLGAIANYL